jgi:glycosyltransferase involved in cell wall biosynthesis
MATYRRQGVKTIAMKFAIITPSFNKARYLRRSVQSVLDQNHADVDYWLLDNCSTDGSIEIIEELKASYGNRLNVVVESDSGQAAAINRGFSLADGEIMGWLNADDFYSPGTLSRVQDFFLQNPETDMLYGRARVLDGNLNFETEYPVQAHRKRVLRSFDYIAQPATFWRRRVWDAVGPLDQRLNWGLDWDYFVRVSNTFQIEFLNEFLADAVCDGEHKTATGGLARTRELGMIAKRYGGWRNPTCLFCHYVLALNWIAAPWLSHPRTAAMSEEVLQKLKSYFMTVSARVFHAQVMS